MKKILYVVCVATLSAALTGCTKKAENETSKEREKIGVYDSRAVAVAFTGSETFKKWLSELETEVKKAETAGDVKLVAELKAKVVAQQNLVHKQGFSTAPVDDILEHVKDKLPAIKKKADVDVLVSKWDKEALAKYPSAEQVNVTMDLVDTFNPDEKQRKSAIEIQKHEPQPLDKVESIKD